MRTCAQWLRQARFHRPLTHVCLGILVLTIAAVSVRGREERQAAAPEGKPQTNAPAQPNPQALPAFRGGANLVRVDVFPTADGKPVRDLAAADFEVFEDGKPQKVESFEHVEISGQIPQDDRREPNTVREARAMAEDSRSRVFVIFLDTYHTELSGSHRMQKVLVDLLDRIIGPDDLFAVMTPEMSPTDLALARRSETTAGMLSRYWTWGRRDQIADIDPIELEYQHCYPEAAIGRCDDPANSGMPPRGFYNGIAKEMIARRRERMVLDALGDLSIYLEGLRDERKAVIAISDGWLLYRPNPSLTRLAPCDQPSAGPQATTGRDGRLTTTESTHHRCEADRGKLAQLDDWQRFQDLLDRANRANVSFYPIDSRGLPAFDTQIYEDTPTTIGVPVYVDKQMLTTRIESLRTLADATDGLAVVENNNLERGVRRIVDDLTSYYLLGYYSTNPKLDGRFRSIKVKVKRTGVDVRARRGYKAPTEEEVTRSHELTAKAAVSGPPPAFQTAIASLAAVRSNFRFITSVSWLAAPIDDSVPGAKSHVWIVGEMDQATSKGQEWLGGAEADVLLTAADGVKIAELTEPVPAPVRIVNVTLPDVPLGPGEYTLRLRLKPSGGGLPFMDTVHFTVADAGDLTGKARLLRRGLSTGVQYVATADPQFRRTDRLRVEVPLLGAVDNARGELLNRTGQVMPVPVETSTQREDATLQWARADASLAPLAPGDYAIRTTIQRGTSTHEILTAFRIVP